MIYVVMFLAMSVDIAGIGGLLSGIFARSFVRAMVWSASFGFFAIAIGLLVRDVAPLVPYPAQVFIALFWGLVGWFLFGCRLAKRRAAKKAVKEAAKT